jgi:biopolymer transport protein ExbD
MGAEVGTGQKSEPNVVPLCDILLVLLIIFMVITPVAQRGIDVKLPETGGEQDPTKGSQGIVLTLELDGSLKINQAPTTFDMLDSELRSIYQTRTDKTIFIRADETQSYKQVLRVIDVAKGAGIEVLGVIPERYTSN